MLKQWRLVVVAANPLSLLGSWIGLMMVEFYGAGEDACDSNGAREYRQEFEGRRGHPGPVRPLAPGSSADQFPISIKHNPFSRK